ncbi:Hypothetical predicted protein [Olea europaea subsp. europaea]|uniref:Uncharacterized protein n=1 Tax=Olea europaea subsp. europaea TaxID=158383 RepID=A0A8S0UFB1_OLEEU|nr:Hypothetical predicted protein [Olea europaea subsp. europaea]
MLKRTSPPRCTVGATVCLVPLKYPSERCAGGTPDCISLELELEPPGDVRDEAPRWNRELDAEVVPTAEERKRKARQLLSLPCQTAIPKQSSAVAPEAGLGQQRKVPFSEAEGLTAPHPYICLHDEALLHPWTYVAYSANGLLRLSPQKPTDGSSYGR